MYRASLDLLLLLLLLVLEYLFFSKVWGDKEDLHIQKAWKFLPAVFLFLSLILGIEEGWFVSVVIIIIIVL